MKGLVIDKDLIDEMLDENISKKRYKEIEVIVNEKAQAVWYEICHICGRKIVWWGFSNDVELGNGNGSTGGTFDPEIYYDEIEMIGHYTNSKKYYDLYDYGFPTRFLWEENWQNEVVENCEKYKTKQEEKKAKEKIKRKENKILKSEIQAKIKSKLTKDELKYIKFK